MVSCMEQETKRNETEKGGTNKKAIQNPQLPRRLGQDRRCPTCGKRRWFQRRFEFFGYWWSQSSRSGGCHDCLGILFTHFGQYRFLKGRGRRRSRCQTRRESGCSGNGGTATDRGGVFIIHAVVVVVVVVAGGSAVVAVAVAGVGVGR